MLADAGLSPLYYAAAAAATIPPGPVLIEDVTLVEKLGQVRTVSDSPV